MQTTIIHSNRKTWSLQVQCDGSLIVRVPLGVTQTQVEKILKQKADWIEKTRQRMINHPMLPPQPKFMAGEKFWYLGKQYPLEIVEKPCLFSFKDGVFRLSKYDQPRAQAVMMAWYREQTRETVTTLIDLYTERYGFDVNKVRITSAKTRWGSCSGRNNLNFVYRLSMAPLSVINYVVIHELAHLNVRNHSKAFWDEVKRLKPNYATDRAWLKKNGHLLTLE